MFPTLPILAAVILFLYIVSALGLAIYGFNTLWLTSRVWGKRALAEARVDGSDLADKEWPTVVVQLPVYNERHVVERLIDACARLDYPLDRLRIQVLDDSTDATTLIAQTRAGAWRARGVQIEVLHRTQRWGYKAGALADALVECDAELIAIFDADFRPDADFLRRLTPHFMGPDGARVGFVQARWGHLNRDYSTLTRCQALALDGHFGVEQPARSQAGYPFGFNGSGGMWRRSCIQDVQVGGWQADTLCEDLDLSYRAQMAGWQGRYVAAVEAPAEIPPQLLAFKRQQFRWAKGSVQSLLKLAPRVWVQKSWPLMARLQGLFHLGNYLLHPLLLFLFLAPLPLMWLRVVPPWWLTFLSLSSLGPPLLYAVAQRRLAPAGWLKEWAYLPVLTLLGVGLSLNNTVAVWQALRGSGGVFLRTPKFRVDETAEQWRASNYVLGLGPMLVTEALLTLYGMATIGLATVTGQWWTIPFMLLYLGGYSLMVGLGLWQAWRSRPQTTTPGTLHKLAEDQG